MVVILVAALVAACSSTEVEPKDGPCRELEEIDSLMWKQPDSAFARLREFAASSKADSLDVFNGHYCQVLISELLYKNDWKQSNRENLLKAVGYFDSIVGMDGADTRKADARSASLRDRNAFIDARAHYINGVGFYERGGVVNACAEYLKTLEVMEGHFEEQELVEHKARFLAYTYNRLGDLFSEQFMMESAITCYKYALEYCKIEPTSPVGIPNILYRIGKQYDKKNELEKARIYYGQALESITDTDNSVYRDIISSKALCDYKIGVSPEQSLDELSIILIQANAENERLNRYLTIGGILFYENNYDSALFYLKPVFENREAGLQDQAANYLYTIYDKQGDRAQLDSLMHFITSRKKMEGENKALVSELEAMFKNYQNQKQERQVEIEREKAMKKAWRIIIPIIVVVLVVYLVLILRNKKRLKKQQEEADRVLGETEQEHEKELKLWQSEAEKTLEETVKKHKEALKKKDSQHEQEMKARQAEALQQIEAVQRSHEEELKRQQAETERLLEEAELKHQQKMEEMMKRHEAELKFQKDQSEKEIEQTRQRHEAELEAERLAYQKEREELQLSLQLSKRNVNTLQEELGRKRSDAEGHYEAFLKEPVCVKINDAVRDLQITTRKPYTSYRVNFDDETLAQFGLVVSAYYGEVKPALLCLYPNIAQEDLLLCYLYLLGMENKQIAVVRQREYSTVRKQAGELRRRLGIEESVRDYVLGVAGVEEFVGK